MNKNLNNKKVVSIDRKIMGKWKTVIDFTKIRKGGVPIDEVIKALKRVK